MTTQYATLREKIAAESAGRKAKYAEFEQWEREAYDAGMAAAQSFEPVPMIVTEHQNPLDDASAVKKQWFVGDGVCGFAWITVHPANSSYAIWAKKNKGYRAAYGGGMQRWVSEFNQSMQRKERFADAYATVLRNHGIKAYSGSRMD